jgi:acid phosphatase type 7
MTPRLLLASAALALGLTACEPPPPLEIPAELPADSSQSEEGAATYELALSNCSPLAVSGVSALSDDGNVPQATLDDDLLTRWSSWGKGTWIRYDLGASRRVAGTAVAWHRGNERTNAFTLATSEDGTTYTDVLSSQSSGTSTAAETYRFAARSARYLRITVQGNSVNEWASIAEARVCAEVTEPATTLSRAPYLQSVTDTGALVAFRTAGSCTPQVRYGAGTATDRVAAGVAGTRHAVRLAGLAAGQAYTYVVEACGSRSTPRQFTTAPPASATRVRFAAMGDFGTGGSSQRAVVDSLLVASRKPELLLALGDNAYDSGTENELRDRLFTPMAALLAQVPMFPSPGNHEYVTNQAQPYLDSFYLPANNPERSERYYSFDWGQVHFVSLDSNCVIGLASADRCTLEAQKRWLAADLAASTKPWKVAYFHHPPWSSGSHGSQLKVRREFGPLFEQYGVSLVLTGHDHDYERTRPMRGDGVAPSGTRGVVYLVVGSGGASLRAFATSQPSWTVVRSASVIGHLEVTVEGSTLTGRLITPSGSAWDTFQITLPAGS